MGFLRVFARRINVRYFCNIDKSPMMKCLNVAEKNDAAKTIAGFLSRGTSQRREGYSPYNKIYEFQANVFGQPTQMVMTSVSGHLLTYEFVATYRSWKSCNPVALFDAPVIKSCPEQFERIKKTLEREIRSCQGLIIWTDCDREGENIGFEIIKVCKDVKPNIRVYRAKFSEITAASINRALNNLGNPNKNVSDAVDVRQELDLRTGAAFTRLQTLRLTKVFPRTLDGKLISYGSCQFPTLGFVVERYKEIENFVPEPFWRIKMNHTIKDLTVDYSWNRDRLFDKQSCEAILDICQENSTATIEHIESKPKSKWRPLPLDTVEMEKNVSRKLRINAKETMRIAEHLYTQGFISYPRTETNIFPQELNLVPLVEQQRVDTRWGPFAERILNEGGPNPRQGKKSDQAHPPIHPTKYANGLTGNEQRIYEYIVRHFLACLSKDALGHETVVRADISGEKFTAKGLMILERNYLDVYTYEKWNAKEIHQYRQGDTFTPSELDMVESSTCAPKLLTEADLIALMEKHGIGTDATHAEHIETIKSREYVGLHENMYFLPGTLGMGLVEGYNNIGLEVSLAKPILRSDFENDLKLICEGRKDHEVVRTEQIAKYRAVFQTVVDKMIEIDQSLAARLNDEPQELPVENNVTLEDYRPVLKCPKCGNDMVLRNKKDGTEKFVSCVGYPACKNAVWFGGNIDRIEVMDESCEVCGPTTKKIKFKFKQNYFPGLPNPNVYCIGGCDSDILEAMEINPSTVRVLRQQPTVNNDNDNLRPNTNRNNANNRQPTVNTNQRQQNNRQNNPTTNTNRNNTQNTSLRGNNNSQASTSSTQRTQSTQRTITSLMPTLQRQQPQNRNNTPQNNHNTPQNNYNASQNNYNGPQNNYNNPQNNYNTPQNNQNAHQTFIVDNDDPDTIVCNCNQPAVLLTVRKDGPNQGKQFYKCTRGTDGGGCDFFLWSDAANTTSSRNNIVNCECNQPATLRTVQKDGPNKGRQFYACPKPFGQGCNFFKWLEDAEASTSSNRFDGGGGGGASSSQNRRSFNNTTTENEHNLVCNCELPAVLRTVQKDGPNKGRQFYSCPKPMDDSCRYFKWIEDAENEGNSSRFNSFGGGGGNTSRAGPSGRGRGRGKGPTSGGKWKNDSQSKRSAPYNSSQPKAKRKCGICGQEGHNRKNCPNG